MTTNLQLQGELGIIAAELLATAFARGERGGVRVEVDGVWYATVHVAGTQLARGAK